MRNLRLKNVTPRGSILVVCCVLTIMIDWSPARAAVNVTQHHTHLPRDGLYINHAFTIAYAGSLTRLTNFNGAIIGNVYAQPLYIEGGPRGQAVVIAVTESNYVFALDALNGSVVWQTNVAPPVPANYLPCHNPTPFGILGTPVVDLSTRAFFFNAITTNLATA